MRVPNGSLRRCFTRFAASDKPRVFRPSAAAVSPLRGYRGHGNLVRDIAAESSSFFHQMADLIIFRRARLVSRLGGRCRRLRRRIGRPRRFRAAEMAR